MLRCLRKRSKNERLDQNRIDVDFIEKNELIYHEKDNDSRLCISKTCEKDVFEIAHDDATHAEHHRAYNQLAKIVFLSRLSRKLHQYIKHCSTCQLNQTKRHRFYEELISIAISNISF